MSCTSYHWPAPYSSIYPCSSPLSFCTSYTRTFFFLLAGLDNLTDQIRATDRITLLDLNAGNLSSMRRRDDHFLHKINNNSHCGFRVLLTIFIALKTASGSPFLTSPPSLTRSSTTTPAIGAPTWLLSPGSALGRLVFSTAALISSTVT
jgi:hypothetical protein